MIFYFLFFLICIILMQTMYINNLSKSLLERFLTEWIMSDKCYGNFLTVKLSINIKSLRKIAQNLKIKFVVDDRDILNISKIFPSTCHLSITQCYSTVGFITYCYSPFDYKFKPNYTFLENLKNLPLTSIGLYSVFLNKEVKQISENFKLLKIINIYYCGISHQAIKFLTKHSLMIIKLYCCESVTDEIFKYFSEIKTLTTIKLKYCYKITGNENIKFLNLPLLTSISIVGCPITNESIKFLSENCKEGLTSINFSWCRGIKSEGIRYLSNFKMLEKIKLNRIYITNNELKYFTKLHLLKILSITGSRITVEGVKIILENLLLLEKLNISEYSMCEFDVEPIKQLNSIKINWIEIEPGRIVPA